MQSLGEGGARPLGGLVFTETVKFQDCYFTLTPGDWRMESLIRPRGSDGRSEVDWEDMFSYS